MYTIWSATIDNSTMKYEMLLIFSDTLGHMKSKSLYRIALTVPSDKSLDSTSTLLSKTVVEYNIIKNSDISS